MNITNHLTAIRLVRNRCDALYKALQDEPILTEKQVDTTIYTIDLMITWLEAAKACLKDRS